uniref:Uncharacterized protein n=1 Tax=Glossina brevipalpis TaxID=37001 RepID=A0A1A9WQ79_9MUSC
MGHAGLNGVSAIDHQSKDRDTLFAGIKPRFSVKPLSNGKLNGPGDQVTSKLLEAIGSTSSLQKRYLKKCFEGRSQVHSSTGEIFAIVYILAALYDILWSYGIRDAFNNYSYNSILILLRNMAKTSELKTSNPLSIFLTPTSLISTKQNDVIFTKLYLKSSKSNISMSKLNLKHTKAVLVRSSESNVKNFKNVYRFQYDIKPEH